MPKTKTTVAEKNVARAARAPDALDASQDLSSIDSLELWARYAEQSEPQLRDKNIRNELVSRYVHIVRYLAERIHARLPNEVDVEDLVTAGCFGLMEAADNFDLARGVKFETFCTQRIRGAIFDELRAMDWVPRLVRSRTNKVEAAKKSFESRTGRAPTDDEIAGELGVDDSEYQKILRDSRPVSMVSLDRKAFDGDSNKDVREIDVIRDNRQDDPSDAVQGAELKTLLEKGLSVTEKLILTLYYYEELTMKDIGRTLDLSESRVSQLHSSILARLKSHLQHRQERDEEE